MKQPHICDVTSKHHIYNSNACLMQQKRYEMGRQRQDEKWM